MNIHSHKMYGHLNIMGNAPASPTLYVCMSVTRSLDTPCINHHAQDVVSNQFTLNVNNVTVEIDIVYLNQ